MAGTEVLSATADYLAHARWFAGKGREYGVVASERVATLPGPPVLTVDLVTVRYAEHEAGDTLETYQLPLAHYAEPQERIAHALVGRFDDASLGPVWSYDAVHDRAAMAAYLAAFAAAPAGGSTAYDGLEFHRVGDRIVDPSAEPSLFRGEQSNSSVTFGSDCLVKVFRKVTAGRNPDIEIHAALTDAGNHAVAALYGWASTGDRDLALVQELLRGATDGWDLALDSARAALSGGADSFAAEAAALGSAVAAVHAVLAEEFPTEPADLTAVAATMLRRLSAQVAVVPDLAAYVAHVRPVLERVAGLNDAVRAQRVHGDLHLGQTLRVADGWRIVDFEGEPAKALAERVLPDSPWRDVAGMLRSFDYAATTAVRERTTGSPDHDDAIALAGREWERRNRAAFLTGYLAGREPTPDELVLIAAYEADKAVYEAGYEARNRPAWLGVPLSALGRMATPPDLDAPLDPPFDTEETA